MPQHSVPPLSVMNRPRYKLWFQSTRPYVNHFHCRTVLQLRHLFISRKWQWKRCSRSPLTVSAVRFFNSQIMANVAHGIRLTECERIWPMYLTSPIQPTAWCSPSPHFRVALPAAVEQSYSSKPRLISDTSFNDAVSVPCRMTGTWDATKFVPFWTKDTIVMVAIHMGRFGSCKFSGLQL
jgi:hypothetical protein